MPNPKNKNISFKDKLPGKHANTTLLLEKNACYSFLLEMIDKDVFEFTVCVYDTLDEMNRHEYVLACNKKSLRDLRNCINSVILK